MSLAGRGFVIEAVAISVMIAFEKSGKLDLASSFGAALSTASPPPIKAPNLPGTFDRRLFTSALSFSMTRPLLQETTHTIRVSHILCLHRLCFNTYLNAVRT